MAFSSSLLDVPTVRERALRFTVEQYHLLGETGLIPEKIELLDGVIVEKMPKSPLHVYTTEGIASLLRPVVPGAWSVRQEQPITCQNSEPEPDLAVVQGSREDYFRVHPTTAEFVIEVAVSSSEIDTEKAAIYAEAQVKEYWIVLPEEKRIEVLTKPAGREYAEHRTVAFPLAANSQVLPAFLLDLATFFPH